uniref:Uncharacterized protein n=1 Tax=Beauveria bassiana polymycovirus 3 TaxID=1740648 RepID=A0A7R9NGR6_9VIRU|nr:protein of unknown function [Beauveria bassiana polymycovirus 3]
MSEASSFVMTGAAAASPRVAEWAADARRASGPVDRSGIGRPVVYPPSTVASAVPSMTRTRRRQSPPATVVDGSDGEESVSPEDADPVPPYVSRQALAPGDSVSLNGNRRMGSAGTTGSTVSLTDSTVDRLAVRIADLNVGSRENRRRLVPTVDEAVATTARHRRPRLSSISERPAVGVLAALVFGTKEIVYDNKRHVLRARRRGH